ncbi:MAG: hypothetical protein K0U98_15440 [Deltaproteobacteria bacterium]|nr:hypothetical protein [Deltaproteobacteria bacterium]
MSSTESKGGDNRPGIGGRLREGAAQEVVDSAHVRELASVQWLHQPMGQVDLAYGTMLADGGLLPSSVVPELLGALLELEEMASSDFPYRPELGDLYSNRLDFLHRRAPQAAPWVSYGRPRREATTTAFLLACRDGLLDLSEATLELARTLLEAARSHTRTSMPDYTYLQRAHPTSLAHYLSTFVGPLVRDLDRIQLAFDHVDQSPGGAGSTNGSRLPLNRQNLAQWLGFGAVHPHPRDAMWQADTAIEVMAVATTSLTHGSRLAEDLLVWASEEFGYLHLADAHSRASVIMPHKKNPYSLTFVRGMARQSIGELAGVTAMQATATGQVDNRVGSYQMIPAGLETAARCCRLLASTLASARFDTEIMEARAARGFGAATDLAEIWVGESEIDPRQAHRWVGRAVRLAKQRGSQHRLDSGNPFTLELLREAAEGIAELPSHWTDEWLAETLHPSRIVESRTGLGGASEASVLEMQKAFQVSLDAKAEWCSARRSALGTARLALRRKARQLCRST